jgi:hypothetical protein
MPGVNLRYETFLPCMWQAVERGFVRHEHAAFVADGLRWGFRAGIDTLKLKGHRWFRNYPTSVSGRKAVTRATMKRVEKGKTLDLGTWSNGLAHLIRTTFSASAIFPLGAVAKPLEPDELRPTDDHTRTGINAATDLSFLGHSLNTYSEIAEFLKQDYFMRVSDVDAAFPMLPLHPDLWPFFMFKFFASDTTTSYNLFMHVCGDFGTAGMPGVFKIFFVDVVVNMARSASVLTLPMPIYVDDMGIIGALEHLVNSQMEAFQEWSFQVCGVLFKTIKDRLASQQQLMLGFWWDSTTLTRSLEERKLAQYLEMFLQFSTRRQLSLREMQSAAGRMQRACMTLPPGAASLLMALFALTAGLRLPWHKRRLTRMVRSNFKHLHALLSQNLGRGYYSYDLFERAPEVRTDASRSGHYAGGGYVSEDGHYGWFRYGRRAAQRPIDFLEGDTVVACVEQMGHRWHGKRVPIGVDNKAFECSGEKGRSKAPRLNILIRELFYLQLRFQCVLDFFWLSSADNLLADHLSRDRESSFLHDAYATGFWDSAVSPLRHASSGETRTLPDRTMFA